MGKEIERRWEVISFPKQTAVYVITIEQAYTQINMNILSRIRKVVSISKPTLPVRFTHTTKYFLKDSIKEEIEASISEEEYISLIDNLALIPIKKTRYCYAIDNTLQAEIDWFEDGGIIVEVEFKDEDQMNSFIPPDWFGNEITSSVSYNIQIFNRKMQKRHMSNE